MIYLPFRELRKNELIPNFEKTVDRRNLLPTTSELQELPRTLLCDRDHDRLVKIPKLKKKKKPKQVSPVPDPELSELFLDRP